MDAMREMILGLEHTAMNPIVVDEDETVVEVRSSSGKELEVKENEVAVSMPLATLVQTSQGLYRSPTGPGW